MNIFGGIMKCDVIAEGVIAAAKELKLQVPLVVRLEGTNVEKGKELLKFIIADKNIIYLQVQPSIKITQNVEANS